MFKTILAAATTAAAFIAAPAIAGTYEAAPKIEIKYKDLNLSSPEGQAQLERRIDAAARKVCHVGEHRTGTRVPATERKACAAKARQSARNQMAAMMNDNRLGG